MIPLAEFLFLMEWLKKKEKKTKQAAFVFSNLFSVRGCGITVIESSDQHCLLEECWEIIYDLLNLLASVSCLALR